MLLDRRSWLVERRFSLTNWSDSYYVVDTDTHRDIGFAIDRGGPDEHLSPLPHEKIFLRLNLQVFAPGDTLPTLTRRKAAGRGPFRASVHDDRDVLLGSSPRF